EAYSQCADPADEGSRLRRGLCLRPRRRRSLFRPELLSRRDAAALALPAGPARAGGRDRPQTEALERPAGPQGRRRGMTQLAAVGGALGSTGRYMAVVQAGRWFGLHFPWGLLGGLTTFSSFSLDAMAL